MEALGLAYGKGARNRDPGVGVEMIALPGRCFTLGSLIDLNSDATNCAKISSACLSFSCLEVNHLFRVHIQYK